MKKKSGMKILAAAAAMALLVGLTLSGQPSLQVKAEAYQTNLTVENSTRNSDWISKDTGSDSGSSSNQTESKPAFESSSSSNQTESKPASESSSSATPAESGSSTDRPLNSTVGAAPAASGGHKHVEKEKPVIPIPTQDQLVIRDAEAALYDAPMTGYGHKVKILMTGYVNTYTGAFMQKVAKFPGEGYDVVFINRYKNADHVILLRPGAEVDPEEKWFGPDYMTNNFEDISEEYAAQQKDLAPQIKVLNILAAE